MPLVFQAVKACILILAVWSYSAVCAPAKLENNPYVVYEDPAAVIERARLNAKQQDKLLLLVLGADWCHDSRGFAARVSEPDMQALLAEHYSAVFMSVGYLDNLNKLIGQFGHPVYFGTPTVLIIEPHSKQLLNRDSLVMWQSADSQPAEAAFEYFSQFSRADARTPPYTYVPAPVLERIRTFENQQATRLYGLYAKLGPELEKDVNDQGEDHFLQFWRDVYQFRTQLQKDLNSLYQRAQQPAETETLLMEDFVAPPRIHWEK